MASSRIYLSGAAKRKQRQIRNQNEAKSRRTLEVLNWYTKIQRNNKSCPDCKVLFLRGEQKISSNFLRGSGTETSVSKPVQTDT